MKNNDLKPSFAFLISSKMRRKDFLYESFFKGKAALDVGCGEGEFLKNDPKRIVGMDANGGLVSRLSGKGFNVRAGTAAKMPFQDRSFQAVHCRNVIEHMNVDEAYAMIKECSRVLAPGGLLVLCSEMPTRKFWGTFGHVKPYPPSSIIKLLRPESREEFDPIADLEYMTVFHIGDYFRNRALYLISACIGYYLPRWFAREYFLVLRKK